MKKQSLESLYKEFEAISEQLDFLEKLIETIIIRELPKAKLSKKELVEIRKAVTKIKGKAPIKRKKLKR